MTVELADLERALAELADSLEFPAASDMPERVIAELDRPASVTPADSKVAISERIATAARSNGKARAAPVPSPRRSWSANSGSSPSSSSARRWPGSGDRCAAIR